jgi:hypothetical protein
MLFVSVVASSLVLALLGPFVLKGLAADGFPQTGDVANN